MSISVNGNGVDGNNETLHPDYEKFVGLIESFTPDPSKSVVDSLSGGGNAPPVYAGHGPISKAKGRPQLVRQCAKGNTGSANQTLSSSG